MKQRATLADVARSAGVSKTTASLVLNGKGEANISEETRQRVATAAAALHFRPHGVARALTRRRADVLGIVCAIDPFVEQVHHHEFEHTLLSAIFSRAMERGYNPLIYNYPPLDAGPERLLRYADGRSDAFILIFPPAECILLKRLHALAIPAVAVMSRETHAEALWVDSDHEAGIQALVGHLAELGHQKIAYLTGPPEEEAVAARVAAFRKALTERGLPVREEWIEPYLWDTEETHNTLKRLLCQPDRPTALLTWYDFAAGDVYLAARQLNLRIPEDLSVVGFDDTHSATILSPALTTVRQDPEGMGRAAVDLALNALSWEVTTSHARTAVSPIQLVVRDSTSPPGRPAEPAMPTSVVVQWTARQESDLSSGVEEH
ncbi:MAG TPA: LacI family DNA-binding transcriptional regulator [Chthonomonadaceae bacterium]|nr:LacI family DNA-binding transcriptional regulator [Chthonomonadaceae bacterium]